MEKMFQRIVTLQQFNEQFALENKNLRQDMQSLDQNIDQLRRKIENCENCQQSHHQITKLTNDNKELYADLAMMKNLVYRLNVQIEAYQDQQRHKQENQTRELAAGDALVDKTSRQLAAPLYRHSLGPLLQAYDETIRDKDELFQQYKREFEHFSGELKRVLEDNNKLLEEHEQLKRDVAGWREERIRLQAALDVCRKKAEAHAHKADLAKEKLVEVVHVYEQRLQSLGLEVEHVQSAYTRCKSELMQLKGLQSQPQETIASSLQQCKELLENLKQEHRSEKLQLQEQISDLQKRNLSSEAKIRTLKQESASLKHETQQHLKSLAEVKQQYSVIQNSLDQVQRSRARLKARLRIALQWAEKLEKGQSEIQGTWDALKRLEIIVKHKESQVRGLHARHLEEIDKMQNKLHAKEETIRQILKSKVTLYVPHSGEEEEEHEDSI